MRLLDKTDESHESIDRLIVSCGLMDFAVNAKSGASALFAD
jgi:hypothetical protein